ncbi:MAG: serine acetyltransferase, partial [Comamonadaceae bacterium]
MPSFNVSAIVGQLQQARHDWRDLQNRSNDTGGREFPSKEALASIVDSLKGALFPMRLGPVDLRQESEDFYVSHTLDAALHALLAQAQLELRYMGRRAGRSEDDAQLSSRAIALVGEFAAALPGIRRMLDSDVLAAYRGDPAARSVDEVLLCYPGVLAMIHHRLAHQLYRLELPLLARIVAELAHSQTGIDLHPGAQIGAGFFIDHGTGVVIGETAVIGERVRVYQAVTLGAKRFPTDDDGQLRKGLPRHPIVEDDVVIYA